MTGDSGQQALLITRGQFPINALLSAKHRVPHPYHPVLSPERLRKAPLLPLLTPADNPIGLETQSTARRNT